MAAIKAPESLADKAFNSGIGIRAMATPNPIRALIVHANQLNSPNKSESPHISESAARMNVTPLASCQLRK
jgi:hypothetical protein